MSDMAPWKLFHLCFIPGWFHSIRCNGRFRSSPLSRWRLNFAAALCKAIQIANSNRTAWALPRNPAPRLIRFLFFCYVDFRTKPDEDFLRRPGRGLCLSRASIIPAHFRGPAHDLPMPF